MLSTVQIVSGTDGTPWTRAERDCVIEIRSEHKMNDPTTFSILMHDVPDRAGVRHRKLAVGRKVAVLVRPRDTGDWTVLFQGKVAEIEEHATQGGVGSTILYRGRDIRTIMAARSFTGTWSGQVDATMRHIINLDFSEAEVDAPDVNEIDAEDSPLGQNSNNLDFLRTQAVTYGHNFWVSYAQVPEAAPGLGSLTAHAGAPPTVDIVPTIHWQRSPYFSGGPAPTGLSLPGLGGDDSGPVTYKVNVDAAQCPNVTAFEVTEDGSHVQTMPDQSGGQVPAGIPEPPTNPLAGAPDDDAPQIYFKPRVVQPGEEEATVNATLEQERGFNRRAKVSSTKAHLHRLPVPNDLATLQGVPDALADLLFRVSEAVHVIRIDGHWIDAVLESDGTAYGAGAGALLDTLGALA